MCWPLRVRASQNVVPGPPAWEPSRELAEVADSQALLQSYCINISGGSAQQSAFLLTAALPAVSPIAGPRFENHLLNWPLGKRRKRDEDCLGVREISENREIRSTMSRYGH